MQQNITDILHIIKEDGGDVSQRDLAQKSGFSLGNVNNLLKKCVQKGLVEIKELSTRKVKYLLTPRGMKVVTQKTLNYVQESYNIISNLEELMQELTEEVYPHKEICILKKENQKYQEVWTLVRSNLNNLNQNYRIYNTAAEIKGHEIDESVVFYWNPELEEDLYNLNIESVNIIHQLRIGKN